MILALAALVIVRVLSPERPLEYVGPRALVDDAFAVGLLGMCLLTSTALGSLIFGWLHLDSLTGLETAVFAAPMGLGVLAYGVMTLGFAGWFSPAPILALSLSVAILVSRRSGRLLEQVVAGARSVRQSWPHIAAGDRAVGIILALFMAVSLPQALLPPWDWDGLVYHLQAPRLFMEAGRFYLLPDVWTGNYPLTLEMIFSIGLSAGSDTFARLLHLAMAGYLVLATYGLARRSLGRTEAALAACLMMGSPILWPEAIDTFNDLYWALCELLALYALVLWTKDKRASWLVLAGICCGLALGTKYLALIQVALLGIWLIWYSRNDGLSEVKRRVSYFTIPLLIIASPWYLKNLMWGGNPVYPLAIGGLDWPAERLQWLNLFLSSFGTGRSVTDYLMLPWNVFARAGEFGFVLSALDWPNPLFLFALIYPLRRRGNVVDGLAWLAAFRFVAWAGGVPISRYLITVFPALSIATAAVLVGITANPNLRRLLLASLVGITCGLALVYQTAFTVVLPAVPVSLGLQSKHQLLARLVPPYQQQSVLDRLAPDRGLVFVAWDGRGYYRDFEYLLDVEQSRWTQWVLADRDAKTLAARLRGLGITHMIFSIDDADFITRVHDPTGQHSLSTAFYWDKFAPACGREIYSDSSSHIIELTCP